MVKRRLSSRLPAHPILLTDAPPIPLDAEEVIAVVTNKPHELPPVSSSAILEARPASQYGNSRSTRQYPNKLLQKNEHGGGKKVVDQNDLWSQYFDAKAFISSKLSNCTDVEISAYADKLISLQEKLNVDRQAMIYENYTTFLTVGRQINNLGTELESLQKLLNDIHVATTAIKDDAEHYLASPEQPQHLRQGSLGEFNASTAASSSGRGQGPLPNRQTNRNSLLMLENMWSQELTKLFKSVEGAQKFLPLIPGRHVLIESDGWYQLNAATWKPLQPIHIVLLNDHLLVATKKKSRNESLTVQSGLNLVADKCWPLAEIQLEDLSMSVQDGKKKGVTQENQLNGQGQHFNGFMIVSGSDSYVYKAASSQSLAKVLKAYNKAIREISKPSNSQNHRASRDSLTAERPDLESSRSQVVSVDLSERARSLRTVDNLINNLDVKIGYRLFNDAVAIIMRTIKELGEVKKFSATAVAASRAPTATSAIAGSVALPPSGQRKGNLLPQPALSAESISSVDIKTLRSQILKIKIDQRKKEVTDILLRDISQDFQGKKSVVNHINLLIQLGQSEAAKSTFLAARHQLISKLLKRVEFRGNLLQYISQIATIYFRMIRTSVDIYQTCFATKMHSSSIVEWAKEEVEEFMVIFAKQLFNLDPKSDIYKKCVEITKEQSAQITAVGLNLEFLLDFIYECQDAPTKK